MNMIKKISLTYCPPNGSETQTHVFGTIFSVSQIPELLAAKLGCSAESLRVYAAEGEVLDKNQNGESLIEICTSISQDKESAQANLELAGFDITDDCAAMFLGVMDSVTVRVGLHRPTVAPTTITATSASMAAEAPQPKAAAKVKSRITKELQGLLEEAVTWVWPRDSNGIPLPSQQPKNAATNGKVMVKPGWVDLHLTGKIRALISEYGLEPAESISDLRTKAAR